MDAWGPDGREEKHNAALRSYLRTRTELARSYRMFEIANHRLFRTPTGLLVPFDAHGLLIVFHVEQGASRVVFEKKYPHGSVFTDESIFGACGLQGEVIDLQREIYQLEAGDMQGVAVHRLRDLAGVLERINASGSRHEVVYLLRFLVARLCSSSSRDLAGAKNLQPEILRLRRALLTFLEGPFASRLMLPARVLVRRISSLLTRPRVIERVWQDTIDLCEVRVRNSSIATEIRRSTHHSLGRRTLELARAYAEWLHTGQACFPAAEHMTPAPADEAARKDPQAIALAERIRDDLEHILGGHQLTERIEEWRKSYAEELLRCESGRSLEEEMALFIARGAIEGNRWVYQQHLRFIDRFASHGGTREEPASGLKSGLETLASSLPGEPGFSVENVRRTLETAVGPFLREIQARHQDALFSELDKLRELIEQEKQLDVFEHCSRLRQRLRELTDGYVFAGQRLLLSQLDCLLEETAYFAARHVAQAYDEEGMDLQQCFSIIRRCAINLSLDGLYSRELWDLTLLLVDPTCGQRAQLDVLEQVQRNYHLLVRRVSEAYEVMAGHLGYGEDEMRGVMGNFFRSMHDLNLLAQLSDAARARLSLPGRAESGSEAPPAGGPWRFQHLSHRQEIIQLVESPGKRSLRDRYGGKGSGLVYLSYLGVPTRDGFIIPTDVARSGLYRDRSRELEKKVREHIAVLEADILREDGRAVRLGDPSRPLLLAVRGGSVFSMPGQLETLVFVGMTRPIVEALARQDEWFAWDAFRRFLASYAASLWQLDLEELHFVDQAKRRHGVTRKIDLPGSAMKAVAERCLDVIAEAGHGAEIEAAIEDADLQLQSAIRSVCRSWNAQRAVRYRAIKHLSDRWNTAVIVQQMAAGNRSNTAGSEADETHMSLTGVIPRTRMQPNGFRSFTGDIKFGASGDDLVGGLTEADSFEPVQHLHELAPMLERRINHVNTRIRRFMGTDAEIEFTVERGVLSVLQTRSAETEHVFKPRTFRDPGEPCGRGIGVMGGAFRGLAAFDEDDAERLAASLERGSPDIDGVLLVLENPVPDEIPLILSVDGLVAARGGSTAHAAVAVNGIDEKPFSAVLGVPQLKVRDRSAQVIGADGSVIGRIESGDTVSIHGQTGELFLGSREIVS